MKKLVVAVAVCIALAVLLLMLPKEIQPTFANNMTFETRSDFLYNYEITRYPSSAVVSPETPEESMTLGVVVDPWNLKFGLIPAGNNVATRFINLVNIKEKPARISFRVYGNISSFVKFSRNDFILGPRENVTVETVFYANDASIGEYTGEIQVIVKRPKLDLLYMFW